MNGIEREENAEWRKSEYVISFPDWGDRGRMLGSSAHPTGTLHRPTCRMLTVDRRVLAFAPARVYPTTLESFTKNAHDSGMGGEQKICKHCCRDIKVAGRRMVKGRS